MTKITTTENRDRKSNAVAICTDRRHRLAPTHAAHKTYLNRVAEVNAALKTRGEEPRLRAGHDYYYFDGPAIAWGASSVYVYRADELTLAEWMHEYDLLKANAR